MPNTETGCRSTETVTITNNGTSDAQITNASIANIPELTVNIGSVPVQLAAGQSITATLSFAPSTAAAHQGILEIAESASQQTYSAPVDAEAFAPAVETETFRQNASEADILLVVDNSASMFDDIAHLQQQLPQLIAELTRRSIDYHIGLITTDDTTPGQAGVLIGTTKVIDSSLADPAFGLGANLGTANQTSGSHFERGFEATRLALSPTLLNGANAGFRRAGANLVITYISDEDDQSIDPVSNYIQDFQALGATTINAIVGDVPNGCASAVAGTRYNQAVASTNGQFDSICGSNWSSALSSFGQFQRQQYFTLNGIPVPSSISVRVNGIVASGIDFNYNPSGNRIEFIQSAIPAANSIIEVSYTNAQTLCGGLTAVLDVAPNPLDFGNTNLRCQSSTLAATITNSGNGPALITRISATANTSAEYTVTTMALPQVIQPGQRVHFNVSYTSIDHGPDFGTVEIHATGLSPVELRLEGTGPRSSAQSQQFRQTTDPRGDILFVIDSSCSMADDQARLRNAASGVVQNLDARGIDYQIGVTTMDMSASGAQGHLQGTPAIVNPFTANGAHALAQNFQVGVNSIGPEQGFAAAVAAISGINTGFYRQNAWLTLIFITDEAEQSAMTVQSFVNHVENLKGPLGSDMIRVNAIAEWPQRCHGSSQAGQGAAYADAAQLSGGVTDSICSNNWNSALTALGTTGYGLQTSFQLSVPPITGRLEVLVNGVMIPAGTGAWAYDESTQSVVFSGSSIPSAGAIITVNFLERC